MRFAASAWEEVEPLSFRTFAVRAKRSDKSFPQTTMEIEAIVGRFLLERLAGKWAGGPRSAKGSGTYLPHRNYARTAAGLRAKNSRVSEGCRRIPRGA